MSRSQKSWQHWQLSRDAEGIAWLNIDVAGSSTNTLGSAVLAELADVLDQLEAEPPRALVLRSGKSGGFIAGADLDEYARIAELAGVLDLVARNWQLFNRFAALPWPTLALIRGHCMGGGLELALACRYRIAVDEPATRLALPEVLLGIVPAWGGMLRLPRLIGPIAALDMMLSGKQIDARRARRSGLVDDCVPPRVMDNAARMLVLSGQAPRVARGLHAWLNGPLRAWVAWQARRQLAHKARREHYPAPWALIDIWQHYGGNALAVPAGDPASLQHIVAQGTARNLVRIFFLQQRLKGLGKQDVPSAQRPRHVHVIGAGVMGGDIAAWCALRGLDVSLQDQDMARIAPALQRAAATFARKFRGERIQQRLALDRLIADPQGRCVPRADVIIEAIYENLAAKQALWRDVEARARSDALLATNTSSLSIEAIRVALVQPRRLVGIHFFNPVAQMPLVEVVAADGTDAEAVRRALAFVQQLDKLPLPVASAPGFVVNAVLGPYLHEAMLCVDEGIAPAEIDAAMQRFGMLMGPVELVDTVGLDIVLAAGPALSGQSRVPQQLAQRAAAGKLGRKAGEGFYRWQKGRPQRSKAHYAAAQLDALAQRLLAPLVAAAQRCVEKGLVADADLVDAGVIFGTGFAPWTGGPLYHSAASTQTAAALEKVAG